MKKIEVNSKCNGCGLCIMNCTYLEENDEGNACPVVGMLIKDDDLEAMKQVVAECPKHALKIVDTGTKKPGMEGVKEVIDNLERKLKNIKIDRVTNIPLNAKDYYLDAPSSNKQYKREYSSESSARSAARDEFNRLCYSESAHKPMIKKILVEYKVRNLKPYYDCKDEPDSAYYQYNEKVRKYLMEAYMEISNLIDKEIIPSEWKEFSCYLDRDEWAIEELERFEECIGDSMIMDMFNELSYQSLDDYVSRLDFEYDEVYVGKGLFGNDKYKDKWYFGNFLSVAREFVDTIKWAVDCKSYDIEESAEQSVNYALEKFEDKFHDMIEEKIKELKKYVKDNF